MSKIAWYENLNTYQWENLVIDILKEKFNLQDTEAKEKYNELLCEIKMSDGICKGGSYSSIRLGIAVKLKSMEITI